MIKVISLDEIRQYIPKTKTEGMAGYSERAHYYGIYDEAGTIVGFTSILWFSHKAKFNNHYIFPEYRCKGYFKEALDFSIERVRISGRDVIEATCTKMSLREYMKRGARIVKSYKKYTAVKIDL